MSTSLHEKKMLEAIYFHIKNNTECGNKIKNSFVSFGEIVDIILKGGTRNSHFDFKIVCSNNITYNVEYKGSIKNTLIDSSKPPWFSGVQFYNGTGSSFTIGHKYACLFYDTMLNTIIQNYSLINEKPSYDIWVKDIFKQGKPSTLFVKELREKGYLSRYLSDCRKEFNKTFILTEDDLNLLTSEVYTIACRVLSEKHYWLQIHGNLDNVDNFNVLWSSELILNPIISTKQIFSKNNCDINVEFVCDNGFKFYAKMRWGYGQCITNLRIDIK